MRNPLRRAGDSRRRTLLSIILEEPDARSPAVATSQGSLGRLLPPSRLWRVRTEETMVTQGAGSAGTRSRSTRQFQAVAAELATSEDFRSAQNIHASMRARGESIGLATVYRALQSLVEF